MAPAPRRRKRFSRLRRVGISAKWALQWRQSLLPKPGTGMRMPRPWQSLSISAHSVPSMNAPGRLRSAHPRASDAPSMAAHGGEGGRQCCLAPARCRNKRIVQGAAWRRASGGGSGRGARSAGPSGHSRRARPANPPDQKCGGSLSTNTKRLPIGNQLNANIGGLK